MLLGARYSSRALGKDLQEYLAHLNVPPTGNLQWAYDHREARDTFERDPAEKGEWLAEQAQRRG